MDIDEIFKIKNREILISNLKYDLDKNVENLLGTITNMFNLEFDTAIKNMTTILSDSEIENADSFIARLVSEMKLKTYNYVDEIVKNKKDVLANNIDKLSFEEENMNKYYELVLETTKKLKEDINTYFKEIFEENDVKLDMFIVDNTKSNKQDLANSRITEYLKNRLYGKIETKIHMEIMIRDNNLINKAKESYIRYQEITSRTVNN